MLTTTPFHAGERAAQQRMGVRDRIEAFARQVIRPYLPDQHREFYASLPFLVAAARDADGRPWATLLAGEPGFARSPDPARLEVTAVPPVGDALAGSLQPGADVGILGIEFATRRRNRVNGRISGRAGSALTVEVMQSFGNCPRHIAPRSWTKVSGDRIPVARRGTRLSAAQQQWVGGADTFFIASGHQGAGDAASNGMDASHRGGEPGFVEVRDARTLVFPDFAGNNHFNTIGNLLLDPRVGVLFVDFARGHLLQLSGRAQIDWRSPAVARTPGAQRLVTVRIEHVVELTDALPIVWSEDEAAPLPLVVVEKRTESEDVASFVLAARDSAPLPPFEPGQHLPIEVDVPGFGRARRTYSLSAAPGLATYRLTVKREPRGLVSNFLHDVVQPGTILRALRPAGGFRLKPGGRPVVLVSVGVGITPMTSMLCSLTADPREVWFVHGARDGAHHPLAAEVRDATIRNARVHSHVCYSRPRETDLQGRDYDQETRVDASTLAALLPTLDADFYLCGPPAFLADLQAGLTARGVPESRLNQESFSGAVMG